MKKAIFKMMALLVTLLLVANLGRGQVTLPHYDGINYTAGQALQTQTGWTLLNTGDDLLIASGNLTYSGLEASTGNKVTFDAAGIDASKAFTQQTSGTVYYSFLLNVTALGSLNTTGGYFTGYVEGATTNYGCSVWTRLDGTGYDIGINPRTTAANTVWSSGTTSLNTTLFIVVSYQIVAGTLNDIVRLWINPTPGAAEPAATLTATNSGTDLANVNRILIRQDGTAATPFIQMDELRVGTSWASVTPLATHILTLNNVGNGYVEYTSVVPSKGLPTCEVSTCTVTFDYNTTVRITAHPRADWRFTGFTGDVDRTKLSTNPIVVTMNGDKTITATFVPLASAIPVSNWAILVGIGLMITFLVIRFRRMV